MSKLQSVVFEKKDGWTPNEMIDWLSENKTLPMKLDNTRTQYRWRIRDPSEFKRFITKKTDRGVLLIIGFEH